MNTSIRFVLAGLAGLNYLYGVVPDEATLEALATLPLKHYIGTIIACGTGFVSPSLVKAGIEKGKTVGGTKS